MTLRLVIGVALIAALAVALVSTGTGRHLLRGAKAEVEIRRMVADLPGVRRLPEARVGMSDGVTLAADVYLPEGTGPWPTVLVRTPYGKRRNGEVRRWVRLFASEGYGVVVQDMRGRWGSGGVFAPWPHAAPDGLASLDWIVAQDWSDGAVGTIGCSAHGEAQWALAAAGHPAHRAMVAMGSGGAAGEIEDLWGFFGFWEGGIYTLASAFGWFTQAGGKTGDRMAPVPVDHAEGLRVVPVRDGVRRFRSDPTDHEALLDGYGVLGWGEEHGFLTGREEIGPAVLVVDTWFDQAVQGSIALWRLARRSAPAAHLIVGPGTHCDDSGPFRSGLVGDYPVAQGPVAPDRDYLAFMDRHLRGGPGRGRVDARVYALGADRWEDHRSWPPEAARPHALGLGPAGDFAGPEMVEIPVDPEDPVPSIGGTLCCTGNPEDRAGPLDQRGIEGRGDVAVWTSPPLAEALDLAGPLEARLTVATEREDADLVVRLTEVFPDGRSILVQEGALRLRYRHAVAEPVAMVPGQAEAVRVRIRDVRRHIPAGHRLRVHVAGSSFPRLERPSGTMAPPGSAEVLLPNRLTLLAGPEQAAELVVTSLAPPVFVARDP